MSKIDIIINNYCWLAARVERTIWNTGALELIKGLNWKGVSQIQFHLIVYVWSIVTLPMCDSETWENGEHQKYFWDVIVLQEKSQSGVGKLTCKQEH